MNQSIEDFLKEPWLIVTKAGRELFWNGSNWVVMYQSPSIHQLYEGPLLSEALAYLRTGRPYWKEEEK